MSQFRAEDDDFAFERRLLGAGLAEPLPVERTEGALQRLTADMAALNAGMASNVAGSGAVAATSSASAYVVAIKWLGLGVLLGGVGTFFWMKSGYSQSSSAPPRASSVAVAAPPTPIASARAAEPATVALRHQERAAPPVPRRFRVAAASASVPAPLPSSDLAAEIAALDGIRTALAIGAWQDAEQQLGRYQRQFSRGALRSEAEVLRIETLVARGNRVAAEGAAERFIAQHPRDPQVARVRALVE